MILSDGVNVTRTRPSRSSLTGAHATAEAAPVAVGTEEDLVDYVQALTVPEIRDLVESGEITASEVAWAEDEDNGGKGRRGVLALADEDLDRKW